MAFTRETGLPSSFMEKLLRTFGEEKVLTDIEDLYVYSFHGEFCIRRRPTPSAVLRLHSESEVKDLMRLAEAERVRVVRNDRPFEEAGPTEQDVPVLLIDARGPLDGADLREKLSELGELVAEGKEGLKIAPSFLRWFISSLRTKDGYRIREFPDCDDGYCAVQPFFDGVETWSSKGRLLLTRGLLRGELTPTRKLIDSIYTCTACGQCYDQVSLTGLEVNNAIVQARHEIVRMGARPKPCRVLMKNILEEGNPMGMSSEDRSLWLEELIDEFSFDCNDVLYWAGCSPSYRLPETVKSTVNVLKKADVDLGMLGDREGCCGLILYLVGLWDEARENALQTSRMVKDLGARVLVTGCAGCYYAFTRVYPEHLNIQLPLEVLHTSQLLESLIDDQRLRPRCVKMKVTWHDPCDLGRHCKVYEAPRKVLKAIPGLELEEMLLNREHATCCGAGGGLWLYDADLAEKVAHSKLNEEISLRDIKGVVTGCPACTLNLRYAARSFSHEIAIYDLVELVNRSL